MNAWADTWSAAAARSGEPISVSRWLGLDVDRSSEPVLAISPDDPRLEARDALLEARARHAFVLLRQQAS